MIHLESVSNPFQPATSRTLHAVEWREGMTLADALAAADLSPLRHTCILDGLAIPEEILAGYPVEDGLRVIVMPSVAGGNFGKMFAEIAVVVAAAVVTAGIGSGFLIGGYALASQTTASLIGAGVALGGNMLVNAFLGGAAPGGADSNSFDPTGPRTVASGGTPIPKGYGSFLSGGNIIASYVSAEGVDNYLNVLVCYGWGKASKIAGVTLNRNSIQNYVGATYMVRYGTNDQTPIPYFNNIVNGYPQDTRVIALAGDYKTGANPGTPVVIQGTGTATQGLQVVIQFPDGIFYSNDDGSLRSLSVAYKIEYSVSGQNAWTVPVIPRTTHDLITYTDSGTVVNAPGWVVVPLDGNFSSGVVYDHDNSTNPTAHRPGDPWTGTQTVVYTNPDGSTYNGSINLTGEWQPCDPNLNQQIVYDWSGGYIVVSDSNQGTLYHTTNIYNLPPNKYDVRVTKYGSAFSGDPIKPLEASNNRTGDQVWIHSINEVQYQDLAYPNMILVGVRALATNQISGANIIVNAQIDYEINAELPGILASYASDNPALVAYDMLTNPLYGGGVPPENVDLPAFASWAAYNDELVSDGFTGTIKRHTFNGVFDSQGTNLWKSLQKVALMSQACIQQIGKTYTVSIDAPVSVPVQVFTSANIAKDSIKDTWVSFDDRSNRVEVTFADAARTYRTDEPCAVMLPGDIQAGVDTKPTRVQLLGCTNRAQAWHWAYRKLWSTDNLLLTRSFDANIEAVACQVGSVIGIQDDITQWANGGRVQAGSTVASLVVDVDALTFAAGEGWTVSVVHPVVARGSGVIQTILGGVIAFAGALPAGNIASLENGLGGFGAVQSVVSANSLYVVGASSFTPGQTVYFYDQDVVDTQPVASVVGSTVTPLAPFMQAPEPDCPWVYGQSAGAFPAKLFTVTNIKRKGDFQFTIDTMQYLPAPDDTPIITETLGTPDAKAAVSGLTAREQYVMANGANGGQGSVIALGWIPGPGTRAVELWVARNEANQALSTESLALTVSKGSTAVLTYPTGSILQVRAVGVDAAGNTAPYSSAPVVTITVQGAGLAPGDVALFGAVPSPAGASFTWSAVANAASYEVRYNADIANANWQSATLLYAGNALAWSDALVRPGCYLIKALTTDAVESVNAASWNYLSSPMRVNIALAAGQNVAVSVTQNVYDPTTQKSSVSIEVPPQALTRVDGTSVIIPQSGLQWSADLTPGTQYFFYLYLAPYTYTLGCATGGALLPPTAASDSLSAATYSNGNYPCSLIQVTTAASGTSGGGSASPNPTPISPPYSGGTPIQYANPNTN